MADGARDGTTDGGRDQAEAAPRLLDLRGLRCPLPVLHTRRALSRSAPGAMLVVRCTDPLAGLDIPNLVRETGDDLVDASHEAGGTRFVLRRRGA